MTGFCVEKITADERLRAADGILRAQALTVTSDARVLGERIVQEARAEADNIMSQARARARQREQAAEANVLQRAAELLAGLEEANATVADRVADMVVDLVLGLFDRLLMQATPRKRIEASLKRLLREAPPRLIDPVLRVHPDDADLLPEVEWDVKRDASLARGACRLEAISGEWYADFDAAVASLRDAIYDVPMQPPAAQDGGEVAAEEDGGY
jgi:flagellar biosynthesis/type III secretory pathway protein FliH